MPFLDHLEELRLAHPPLAGRGRGRVRHRPLAGPAVPARQPPQAADRAVPHRRGGKLIVTSPTEPVMIVFKLGLPRRPGARLAGHPLAALGLPGARAVRAGEARAGARALRRAGAVPHRRGAGLPSSSCRRRSGCCSASRPKRSQPFITYDAYFDFVLQVVLALGISFELPLVIIILAWLERDRPGGAGTGSAATRSWLAFVAGRRALAGHRPPLDDHDDDPAAPALRGGVRGRGRDPAPAPEGGGRRPGWCCWRSGARRRAGRGAGAGPAAAGRRRGRPSAIRSRTDSTPEQGRARRSTAPPPAGWASPPRPPGASRPRLGAHGCSRRARAISPPDIGPIPPRCSSRSSGSCCKGEALTERQGALLEADTIRYQRDSCMLDADGRSAPVRPRTGAGGRGHPLRHLHAAAAS